MYRRLRHHDDRNGAAADLPRLHRWGRNDAMSYQGFCQGCVRPRLVAGASSLYPRASPASACVLHLGVMRGASG
jgi:hypothetical protein